MPAADIHPHIAGAARVVLRNTRPLMLHGIDEVIRQPGAGLVQPLQLVFLRPGIGIVQGGPQGLHVTRQAIGHGLIDVHHMLGPARCPGGGHEVVELVALAVGRGDHAQFQAVTGDHGKEGRPDLAAVGMEGELIQKDIGAEASGRVGVGRQRGHTGAVSHDHLQGLAGGGVRQVKVRLQALEGGPVGPQMYLEAFLHGFAGLPFPAREDDPAHTAFFHFGLDHVLGDLQRAGVGLARLAREHADLEAALVVYPAALVGIEDGTGLSGETHGRHGRPPPSFWHC